MATASAGPAAAAQFVLSAAAIDGAALKARMHDPAAGGFACFEGWVRNVHLGRSVRGLEYQSYEVLALAEGARILQEARQRFDVLHALAAHRTGALAVGELAIWVGASAAHRDAAFQACRWIVDAIKQRVPIWKHEHYLDGSSGWIHPQH